MHRVLLPGVKPLLTALSLIALAACQAERPQTEVRMITPQGHPSLPPTTTLSPSPSPLVTGLYPLRPATIEAGFKAFALTLTGDVQTAIDAARTPRPASFFWTATPDLRPTGTPDFAGAPHESTETGFIFPGWPQDFGLVCYKTIDPPEGLEINNHWMQWDGKDKDRVYVYAGATASSAAEGRGSLLVAHKWDPCTWEEYISPGAYGPLTILDERRHTLQVLARDRTYYFDIDSRLFVSSLPTPLQQATPQ
jgi:hypothetical protein